MARNQFAVDHDACGVGFVTRLGHRGSHEIVERALEVLRRLAHRGGVDADGRSGAASSRKFRIPSYESRRDGMGSICRRYLAWGWCSCRPGMRMRRGP